MAEKNWYRDFIEATYFGSVAAERIDDVIACFQQDARVIIRHGDNPERHFAVNASREESPLRDFYGHLCGNYSVSFSEFVHFIDVDAQRAASHFLVHLVPKPDGLYADAGSQRLLNCNFFQFYDGLIRHMIIYYANPPADDLAPTSHAQPTGYPQR